MGKIKETFNKDLEELKSKISVMNNTINEIKNSLALYDIHHTKILFDPAPREMEIRTQINKWDLMKLKSFCTARETINNMKIQQIGRASCRERV